MPSLLYKYRIGDSSIITIESLICLAHFLTFYILFDSPLSQQCQGFKYRLSIRDLISRPIYFLYIKFSIYKNEGIKSFK